MTHWTSKLLGGLSGSIFVAHFACAASIDLSPFVSAGIAHDSNVFRFTDSQEALEETGSTDKSDDWYTIEGGAKGTLSVSRQDIIVDAAINRNEYDRYFFLDYTGGRVSAVLNWVRGSLWSGTAGYRFVRTLAGFTEFQNPIQDIKSQHNLFARAERKLTTKWSLPFGVSYRDSDFSTRSTRDREVVTGDVGLVYTSRKGNRIGIVSELADAQFPNREVNVANGVDDGYQTFNLSGKINWAPQRNSRVEARLGYTEREQDNVSSADFDGVTGRISYSMQPTGKTKLTTQIWRELSALSDEAANYAKVTGISLTPEWQITNKLALTAEVEYSERDFEGQPDLEDQVVEDRKDDVIAARVSLSYDITRIFEVSLTYETGDRDSNRPEREYDFNTVLAKVRANF